MSVHLYPFWVLFLISVRADFGSSLNRTDSTLFHIETEHANLFHVETRQKFCGCEERPKLDALKATLWAPQDFLANDNNSPLWLGGIESPSALNCGQFCLAFNKRTTHFTYEDKTMCHCYTGLVAFSCEEEIGFTEHVVCLTRKKVLDSPMKRPLFAPPKRIEDGRGKSKRNNAYEEDEEYNEAREDNTYSVNTVIVLIGFVLFFLSMMVVQTIFDNKKKARERIANARPRRERASNETIATVASSVPESSGPSTASSSTASSEISPVWRVSVV